MMLERWIKFIIKAAWCVFRITAANGFRSRRICLTRSRFKLHERPWHKHAFIFNPPPACMHTLWISGARHAPLHPLTPVLQIFRHKGKRKTEGEFRKLLSNPASCIQRHDLITWRGLKPGTAPAAASRYVNASADQQVVVAFNWRENGPKNHIILSGPQLNWKAPFVLGYRFIISVSFVVSAHFYSAFRITEPKTVPQGSGFRDVELWNENNPISDIERSKNKWKKVKYSSLFHHHTCPGPSSRHHHHPTSEVSRATARGRCHWMGGTLCIV